MQELLSPQLNVSYVEASEPPPVGLVLKHYLASAVVYGGLLGLLWVNPWFKGLLSVSVDGFSAMQLYCRLYVIYLGAALPIYLWLRPRSLWGSKNLLILGCLRRAGQTAWQHLRGVPGPAWEMSYREKHALMFLLIKLFYGPLMLNSAIIELNACVRISHVYHGPLLIGKLNFGYVMFVHLVFLVDAALFFVGYHTEAGFLRNEVRYVETNLWHILVCIVCYLPFNQATISLLGPAFNDPFIVVLGSFRSVWTWGLRAAAVLFLCLLTASSLSLFPRASNLTNRGIVTWGPYRWVRHPGYLAKNMFWLMTLIPSLIPAAGTVLFSWPQFLVQSGCTLCGFAAWGTIYFLRAVTEERFLSRDPEYVAYCQKVRWRFIPGVY